MKSQLTRMAWLGCVVVASTLSALALAATASARSAQLTSRVGGAVHQAWPNGGAAPRSAVTRWLALQTGPTAVRAEHGRLAIRASADSDSSGTLGAGFRRGPGGWDSGDLASPAALDLVSIVPTGSSTLRLVRSFEIPTDDPSYAQLTNWSWTYDSAMSAAAFTVAGETPEAEQVLDQLSALQHPDGSIEFAFDVANGDAASLFRAGTIASVGLAGSIFDEHNHSSRYLAMELRAASYLLSLQGANGLVRGGPDVTWQSTQHNLLTYAFLVHLGRELKADGKRSDAATYYTAAEEIAAGINANLLVQNGSTAYFNEGYEDDFQALDADALGVMYLQSRGQHTLADEVLKYVEMNFAASDRSIVLSSDPATFNMTYTAPGPFSGFTPYTGAGAPDVLWFEGSAEVLLAQSTLHETKAPLDKALTDLADVTSDQGAPPLQADQTLTNATYGVQYNVWPAAAAGAWLVLAQQQPRTHLFLRPAGS